MKVHDSRRARRASSALTLTEMVVVMAMCAIVAGMIVPMLFRSRAAARTVMCCEHLRGIGQAYSLCLQDNAGKLPDAYYSFNGFGGTYEVSVRTPGAETPDTLLGGESKKSLVCPADSNPVAVAGRNMSGSLATIDSSYAYNVALPLLYRNASRVSKPAEIVTFYDGDLSVVAGTTWEYDQAWAQKTIRYRHRGDANFLFADGHVERIGRYPGITFVGGVEWLASTRDTRAMGPEPLTNDVPTPHGLNGAVTINLNPSNSVGNEFTLTLPDGTTVTRDDLANDTTKSCVGFNPNYLEYTGPAVVVNFKPKGNGNQNGMNLDGVPYPIQNGTRYVIASQNMTVHLYNDQRNAKGKAMGKWWIEITATNATVQQL